MNNQTVRDYFSEAKQIFSNIEAAIFTTFTFDPDFFENNVLPLLFDVTDIVENQHRNNVNNNLMKKNVTVFYDKNNSIRNSGKYRYQISGIKLENRYFHPKVIVLAGKDIEGNNLIAVIVLSANLTLNGWGRQEEVASAVLIRSKRQDILKDDLMEFLIFLENIINKNSDAIHDIKKTLNNLPDLVIKLERDKNALLYFGGISKKDPFQKILTGNNSRRSGKLISISPYWMDVIDQADLFRAKEYIFVPARNQNGLYNLTPSQANELTNSTQMKVSFRDFETKGFSKIIFRHAKAYFFIKRKKIKIALGSCNFTQHGFVSYRIEKDNKEGWGNVEAMLIMTVDYAKNSKVIPDLPRNIYPFDKNNAEINPPNEDLPIIPFNITVILDWKERAYFYSYEECDNKAYLSEVWLSLPGIKDQFNLISNSNGKIELQEDMSHYCAFFTVHYKCKNEIYSYSGIILEINLIDSDKDYTVKLDSADILESWRSNSTDIPESNSNDKDTVKNTKEKNELEIISEENYKIISDSNSNHAFNFYDDYRALYDLNSKLKKALSENDINLIKGYMLFRPDSIKRFVKALDIINPPERIFCLAKELSLIVNRYKKYINDNSLCENLDKIISKERTNLLIKIKNELPTHTSEVIDPESILNWYEQQLEKI